MQLPAEIGGWRPVGGRSVDEGPDEGGLMRRPGQRAGDGAGGVQTEPQLVRRAVAGDKEAFADLYESHLDSLVRYFYYRTASREDAEDLAEQVFLKAWRAMPRFRPGATPFAAWLFRLAHNQLVDHSRARPANTRPLEPDLEVIDPGLGPEEAAARWLEARELAEAIRRLSPVEQTVVVLRYVEELDHRSVALSIGKSEVATRSILSRSLVRLGRILRARAGSNDDER